MVTGFADFAVHIGFERFDFFLVKQAFANEKERKFGDWVATRLFFALLGGLVEFFVVGKRMRVGANNVRVKQRGAAALADVVDGFFTELSSRSVPSISATCKPGKSRTNLEMLPPAVCTSTGTEMA